MTERTIRVDYLARVEGEGAFRLRMTGGRVEEAELRIFEPPRFFEAFLKGRSYAEAPDITARICGICPVAYQMSSTQAMERALGLRVDPALKDLRRLLYCGEWIESHALHIYLLHAPDFLGYPDAIRLAKDHPEAVARGLALKKAGNAVLETLGGRSVHPINVRVGGFYRVPTREEMDRLRSVLSGALAEAEETVRFVSGFPFPPVEEDYEFVALTSPDEYPLGEGTVTSSAGFTVPPERFEEVFEESQVPYSHALKSHRRKAGAYLVGPLARYALNHDRLTPRVRQAARDAGLPPVVRNPDQSIVVRALEVLYAVEEGLRLAEAYRVPPRPAVEMPDPVPAAEGVGITEAPRGMLYHRYRLGEGGIIQEARIVAPTSQNQARIEEDLRHLAERTPDLDEARLTSALEHAIRNHDPCISCATHFLKLDLVRQ